MAQGYLAAIVLALALAVPVQAEVLSEILPPKWSELSPQQRQVLTPLQFEWDSLDDARRNKWLSIANRYPRMSAEEQQRVQTRMKQWTELTPEQRRKARERYRKLQKISPDQHETLKQKWQEYESLPEEEKKRLKESAKPRHYSRNTASRRTSPNAAQPKQEAAKPASALPTQPPQSGSSANAPPAVPTRAGEIGTTVPQGTAPEHPASPRP